MELTASSYIQEHRHVVGLINVQNAAGVKAKTHGIKAMTAHRGPQVEMLEMAVEVVALAHLVLFHSNLVTSSYKLKVGLSGFKPF